MHGPRLVGLIGLLVATLLAASHAAGATPLAQTPGPGLPLTSPAELDPATTAVVVLDLSTRCSDPAQICREIAPAVARFVDRARARGVPIVYTVSAAARGTALGDVWEGFN